MLKGVGGHNVPVPQARMRANKGDLPTTVPDVSGETPSASVDSPEFKMLLDPDRFVDTKGGMKKLWKKLEGAAAEVGVEVEKAPKKEVRTEDVSYLDTADGQLREQGYILRHRDVHGSSKKDSLMLKFRDSDPAKVSAAEVAVAPDQSSKSKFELDRTFQDTEQSVFSKSAKVKMSELRQPTIKSMAVAFPTLEKLGLSADTPLQTMGGGAIRQERHLLGDVRVGAGTEGTAPAYLTLWFEEDAPVVAEVSFATLNQGDPNVVKNSENLMRHLHDNASKWLSNGSTKTDFAYSSETS